MNINFGDTGYVVKYIQVFLNENYDSSLPITGEYDSDTHRALIGYLNTPNVNTNMTDLSGEVLSRFSFISDNAFINSIGLNSIEFRIDLSRLTYISGYNGDPDYFYYLGKNEELNLDYGYIRSTLASYNNGQVMVYDPVTGQYTGNNMSTTAWYNTLTSSGRNTLNNACIEYIRNYIGRYMDDNRDTIYSFYKDNGWHITEYTNHNIEDINYLSISAAMNDTPNVFPHKDALCMLNQANEDSMYSTCIRDGYSYDDLVQDCDNNGTEYKLYNIPCNGKRIFSISHGYDFGVNIYIASCRYDRKNIVKNKTLVNKTVSIYLEPGDHYIYETDERTKTLLVQMPQMSGNAIDISTIVMLGDLNSDGIISVDDVALFDAYWAYMLLMEKFGSRNNIVRYIQQAIDATKDTNGEINYSNINYNTITSDFEVYTSLWSNTPLITEVYNVEYRNKICIIKFHLHTFSINHSGSGTKNYSYKMEYFFDDVTRRDFIRIISEDEEGKTINSNRYHINERFKTIAKIIRDNSNKIIYDRSRSELAHSIAENRTISGGVMGSQGDRTARYAYKSEGTSDNNRLLAIDVTNFDTINDIEYTNIPFSDFITNKWIVHNKLASFILGMTVSQYSDEFEIVNAREIVKEVIDRNLDDTSTIYDEDIKEIVKEYQHDMGFSFSMGYMDNETEAYLRRALGNNR